jgi:uncharacterized protein
MKNLFKIVSLAITSLFIVNTSHAQKENSLLWEIAGNGIEKPSYLYGTIHMICENDFFMKEKVSKAFEKTSKMALEINLADADEITYMQKAVMGTTALTKKLTPEQSKELDELLQKTTGMSLSQVDNFTMTTVMSLITMKSFGCANLKFYEMEFIAKAKAANKTIIGLEKIKEQLDLLDSAYTDQEMITMLKELNGEESKKMVQNYIHEDVSNLYLNVTDKKFMNEKTKSVILDQRNRNWAVLMPELMKKESVFFAVGAGHLGGEGGVINLLRKAGYTVKPILN